MCITQLHLKIKELILTTSDIGDIMCRTLTPRWHHGRQHHMIIRISSVIYRLCRPWHVGDNVMAEGNIISLWLLLFRYRYDCMTLLKLFYIIYSFNYIHKM